MLCKLSAIVLAATALVSANPIEKRAEATCTFVATPDGTPDLSSDPLFSEWNYLIGVNFSKDLPSGTITTGGNSTVTGPGADGAYTIVQTIGTEVRTEPEVKIVLTGFVGQVFEGPWTHVNWHIDSVAC